MPAQTGAEIQTTLGGSVSGNIKHIGGGALVHNGEVLPDSEVSPSRQEIAFSRPAFLSDFRMLWTDSPSKSARGKWRRVGNPGEMPLIGPLNALVLRFLRTLCSAWD